jgi:hypothetical protein
MWYPKRSRSDRLYWVSKSQQTHDVVQLTDHDPHRRLTIVTIEGIEVFIDFSFMSVFYIYICILRLTGFRDLPVSLKRPQHVYFISYIYIYYIDKGLFSVLFLRIKICKKTKLCIPDRTFRTTFYLFTVL